MKLPSAWEWLKPCLFLLAAGLAVRYCPTFGYPLTWLSDLAHPLSDALLVAAFVSVAVDVHLKRNLIRDAIPYILGHASPPEIRSHIAKVMGTRLVRQHLRAHYSFTLADAEKVDVTVTYSWDVYNFGSHPEKYASALVTSCHESPQLISCTRNLNPSQKGKRGHWGPSDLKSQQDNNCVTWKLDSVAIPVQDSRSAWPQSSSCSIEWRFKLRKHNHSDTDIAFDIPAIGVTITVEAPEGLEPIPKPLRLST